MADYLVSLSNALRHIRTSIEGLADRIEDLYYIRKADCERTNVVPLTPRVET